MRVTKKNTAKMQIKDSKNYKEHEESYEQLLTTRKPENTAETIAEE